jgi:acetoin utilization deacetylase AcuC-like enzyme
MEKVSNNSTTDLENEITNQFNQMSLKQEKIGYVFDERMLLHKNFSDNHVERPERAMSIYMNLYFKGLLEKMIRLPSEEITEEDLLRVHSKEYIDKVSDLRYNTSSDGKKEERKQVENKFRLCHDSYDNYHTYQSAKVSAGSLLSVCKSVAKKKVDHAFAIIRPPGHHANSEECRGFCFFNNVAIAADYLIKEHKYKVAIVDWDVHHGDGTQEIFYNKNNPLMISLHRHDNGTFYPNTGKHTESGKDSGTGFTVNIPWNTNVITQSQPKASIGDDEYFYAFETIVIPVLKEYKPDVILVSSGFDAAENDPLGKMSLTPMGYSLMTHKLKSLSTRLIVCLEGGYNIDSLSRCSEAIIRTLLNEPAGFKDLLLKPEINNLPLNVFNLNQKYFAPSFYAIEQINSIKNYLSEFWPSLKEVKVTTPKRNLIRKDNEEQYSRLKELLGEDHQFLLDEVMQTSFNNKNEIDFVKFRIGKFDENHRKLNVKNILKKINVDNKSISAASRFRLEGINLKISNHRHSFNEKHFNWTSRDGMYDTNLESISYLISKFLVTKKAKKQDLIDKLKHFANSYEKLFVEKNLDLLNVDILLIPIEITNENSKFKKTKVNILLKLNGIKNYSIITVEDNDKTKNNFYSGLMNLIGFLDENILE